MGSRMITQALPMTEPEAPLVQSGIPGTGESFESLFGTDMGAAKSKVDGTVLEVTADNIKIRGKDRRVHNVELYNNHPYNRKSIVGSTVILVKRKDGSIWRGAISAYVHDDGDQALAVDPRTKRSAWHRITATQKHKNDKKLILVRTRSGRSVVVTADHSLLTLDELGQLAPIYPCDCIVNRTRLPVAMIHDAVDDTTLDYNRGVLAGLYLSEGHCPPSQPGLVGIAVAPDNRAAEVMTLCRQLGTKPFRSGGQVCFTDHPLCEWLTTTFGHLSGNKRVPATFLTAARAFRDGLINGYMAGDGCLSQDNGGAVQLVAVSTSRQLRDDLVDVLLSLGIFTSLFDAPRQHLNAAWNDAYGFRVINQCLDGMSMWFFYCDRECRLQAMRSEHYRASPYALVPIWPSRHARKLLYDAHPHVTSYLHKTAWEGAVAKHRLRGCAGVYGQWAKSDVLWDPIVAIQPVDGESEEFVYDLCVEEAEAFAVCHGLVVHNTFVHNTPTVRPGDQVSAGDIVASSNFTDSQGVTALGKNVRVAYLAHKGFNFEDATVISESFAKRASSEHMYQHGLNLGKDTKASKHAFISIFPGTYDRKVLENYDDNGIIKPGTEVRMDEPLILAVKPRTAGPRIGRRKAAWTDASVKWEHHSPGLVTDVYKGNKDISVIVKSVNPTQVGDKFSGRYGDKGVVAAIVPDDEMPHGPDGKPYEMLLNPLGVISRGNPSQVLEASLGKIAALTGKPYRLADFESPDDLREFVEKELRKHNLTSTVTITDPQTGRETKDILDGNRFIMKLHHTAEAKSQGRATGGYTAEGQPAKGGASGSKRVGMLELNALLSHGAYKTIRDASLIRGQRNEEYWRQVMSGFSPPDPEVPFVYEKFVAQLKGAGINPVKQGSRLNIMAMTNNDVHTLTEDRELTNAETVDWRLGKLTPKRGGLFDTTNTGGHGGNQWSYIKLPEPLPNPVMEEPIRRILGMTQKQYESVLSGAESVPGRDDMTGPAGLRAALDDINIKKELEKARAEIRGGKKTYRDKAIRRLQFLKAADTLKQHPRDWMLDRVPVLPPIFRPISLMSETGARLINDANFLYKELWDASDNLKKMSELSDDVTEERLAVYKAFKGITGLGDPIQPEHREQNIKGILKHVFGSSPKYGTVQRKLLGTTVDLVGRATITPNPNLDMDQVGLPIDKAWTLYQPFVVRRLVRRGMGTLKAMQAVKDRTDAALTELQGEMKTRPVIINRAPVLHRYGVMAFWPQLTSSETLEIPPLTVSGFNADFDGDAMQFHVPSSDSAVKESVNKLMPSRNLLAAGDFDVNYSPSMEYVGGLWAASSERDKKPVRSFRSKKDALRAYARGEINVGQRIEVLEG